MGPRGRAAERGREGSTGSWLEEGLFVPVLPAQLLHPALPQSLLCPTCILTPVVRALSHTEVRHSLSFRGQGALRISVKDTGPGGCCGPTWKLALFSCLTKQLAAPKQGRLPGSCSARLSLESLPSPWCEQKRLRTWGEKGRGVREGLHPGARTLQRSGDCSVLTPSAPSPCWCWLH